MEHAFQKVVKEQKRMCEIHTYGCHECELAALPGQDPCLTRIFNNPEQAGEIIMTWAKEHPEKTFLDDFKEKYPNAGMKGGTPQCCPYNLGYEPADGVTDNACTNYNMSCTDCWNRPMEVNK